MKKQAQEVISTNPTVVLKQVEDIIKKNISFPLIPSPGGMGFFGAPTNIDEASGILSVKATTSEDDKIIVSLGIFKNQDEPVASIKKALNKISNLGEKVWLQQNKVDFFEAAFKVDPTPMGIARLERLNQKVEEIVELAEFLQQTLASPGADHKKLIEKYKKVKSILSPVFPLGEDLKPGDQFLLKAEKVMKLVNAGISVAISSEQQLHLEYFLAFIARKMALVGSTLGQYSENTLVTRGILEVVEKAPGLVSFPSIVLSFGTNVYDRASELDALMAMLSKKGSPALFTGNYAEHQTVFGSGQGTQAYPLKPAIIHLNNEELPLESLISFAMDREIRDTPGISQTKKEHIFSQVMNLYEEGKLEANDLDLITPIIKSSLADEHYNPDKTLDILGSQKETFRGLRISIKQNRNEANQQLIFKSIMSGEFKTYLKQHLIGQEEAINKAIGRLQSEFLTRPMFLPVRMLLQGISGVGKSEFTQCLANFLNIPHRSVDTASLQSYHEASSLLLGSGRGIVQSYMPGKLETMAKHHDGCILEVADLDHCEPSVRAFIADLFLHILQQGYVQTATGETVSCANLIIIFTINLPGGKDEAVLKGLGFNSSLSSDEILSQTLKEIKALFSGAFAGRVGYPIMFRPFTPIEKADIMEMALSKCLKTSLQNIKSEISEVVITRGIGKGFLSQIEMLDQGLGARAIYDMAGELVTRLMIDNFEMIKKLKKGPLVIKRTNNNQLYIN